jgi:hypothetical protein
MIGAHVFLVAPRRDRPEIGVRVRDHR